MLRNRTDKFAERKRTNNERKKKRDSHIDRLILIRKRPHSQKEKKQREREKEKRKRTKHMNTENRF